MLWRIEWRIQRRKFALRSEAACSNVATIMVTIVKWASWANHAPAVILRSYNVFFVPQHVTPLANAYCTIKGSLRLHGDNFSTQDAPSSSCLCAMKSVTLA